MHEGEAGIATAQAVDGSDAPVRGAVVRDPENAARMGVRGRQLRVSCLRRRA
jgi:hypothetical protein